MDLSSFKYVVAMAVAQNGYELGEDGAFYPLEGNGGPLRFSWDYLELPYTVTGTYSSNNGKFNKVLGNVAIVDCNYFFIDLLDGLQKTVIQ